MPPPRRKNDLGILSRFGTNLQRERRAREITQERFAELIDVHPRIVQKIEAGDLNPKTTTLVRIQAVLGCPWERLVGGLIRH